MHPAAALAEFATSALALQTTEAPATPAPREIAGVTLPLWGEIALLLVGSLVAATLIEAVVTVLARRLDPSEGTIRGVVFEEIHVPLYVSVFLWGVYQSLVLIGSPALTVIMNLTLTVVLVLWMRAAIRVGNRGLERIKERDRSYEFAPMLKNLWSVSVVVTALVGLLVIWEIDVTPLLASAGIIGIIIGFAAQDAVSNFIGGVALYFDDTYKLGDFIVLETGEKGTVVDIGLRSTTLLTRERVMVTVPNSLLNSAHVINESAPQRYKRIGLSIRVAYGTDADLVEEILLEEAEDANYVRETPRPEVRFMEFGDSGIEYELRVFVPHPTRASRARHAVNTAVYKRFAEEGIEVPYPRRDVRMRGDEPADVPTGVPPEPPADDPEPVADDAGDAGRADEASDDPAANDGR
ncbi:hypothetical protein JCM17823_15860 [Halorubrum gandharaense]